MAVWAGQLGEGGNDLLGLLRGKNRSVVVPPDRWLHQHFNAGAAPARYPALRWGSWRYKFTAGARDGATFTSIKHGGDQLEFEDEDPQIHLDFEATVAKAGATCQMGDYHPFCTQKKAAAE